MPFTPGQRPDPFENTKRVVNKVKDVFDGKTESEKRAHERKKLQKKVQKLRTARMKKSANDREGLTRQIKHTEAQIKDLQKSGFDSPRKTETPVFASGNQAEASRVQFRNNESTVDLNQVQADLERSKPEKQSLSINLKNTALNPKEFKALSSIENQFDAWVEPNRSGGTFALKMNGEYPRFYENKDALIRDLDKKLVLDSDSIQLLQKFDFKLDLS